MLLRELHTTLPKFFDCNIPVEVASKPGAGKSESIDQIVDRMSIRDGFEWGLSKVFIATLSPVDINGYLVPGTIQVKNPETGEIETIRVSEFTLPSFMISTKRRPMNSYKRGVVVFEEWDKGDPNVKKASAEVILNGRAGQHWLHPGIARIALVNRTEHRSGSTKNFDFIINRRAELSVTPEVNGWLEWALANAVDPMFQAFADRHPDTIFSEAMPEIQGPFCTPRSFVKLSKVFPAFTDASGKLIHDTTTTEIAAGMIGVAAATEFMNWVLIKNESPDYGEIVRDPKACRVPDRPDAKLLLCYELAHKVDKKDMPKVVSYVQRFPAEFSITFAKAATKRDYDLVNVPAMSEWVTKNASLFNAIGGAR